jgi:hypothetical protein
MPKKRTKKSTSKKKMTQKQIQEALLENNVKLQKVMTNVVVKLDGLSEEISKLLQLFEIAAKSFVKKETEGQNADGDLLLKLDTLLNQNKTIAKGLGLMEEKIRHRIETPESELHGVPRPHNEAELHGLYPKKSGRPIPRKFPNF